MVDLLNLFGQAGTEVFYNIPKSVATGTYAGALTKGAKVQVPTMLRFPIIGGTSAFKNAPIVEPNIGYGFYSKSETISEQIAPTAGKTAESPWYVKMFGETPSKTIEAAVPKKDMTTTAAKVGGGLAAGFSGSTAIAGGAGLLGGLLGGMFLFGGKGAAPQSQQFGAQQPITITKTSTYAPVTTYNLQETIANTYQTISNSPNASMTKKDIIGGTATATPTSTPSISIIPSSTAGQTGTQGQGANMTSLALIAAIGLIGYGFVSRPSGGKRRK
jgi:hypothetical protein